MIRNIPHLINIRNKPHTRYNRADLTGKVSGTGRTLAASGLIQPARYLNRTLWTSGWIWPEASLRPLMAVTAAMVCW